MAARDAAPGARPSAQPDNCPLCLEPLGFNALVLECGHCFHSRCCVQFLMSEFEAAGSARDCGFRCE